MVLYLHRGQIQTAMSSLVKHIFQRLLTSLSIQRASTLLTLFRRAAGVPDSPSKASQNLKNQPGPVSKQIIENSIDKSRGSFEGVQQQQQHLTEQGQDKSLTSYEGDLHEDSSVAKPMNNVGNQEVASSFIADSDIFWRSVFPAYMRSKDEEEHLSVSEDGHSNGSAKGLGLNGAAAARAAAAAAASAKELESHVNSLTNPSLMPSSLAPPCSSAQKPTGGKKLEDLISDDPIWAAIRAEARLEAEREPLLSSFLYASILAHPCFERSLGFVLANRLKNATLLATQLMDVFDDVLTRDANIRQAVRLDVQAVKDRDPSCRSYSSALLYLKGYHALQSYRVAHVLWNRGQMVLALALQSRISEVFAVDIHPAARIGKAILLDHGTGVVIGETAVVGDRVSMLQGVTLGGTGKIAGDRHPKIGEGVLIGAGATILGNISVGRGAMVAAGSLVLKDVPPHSMVAGTPARVVGVLEEPTPSLTMKHDVTKDLWESMGDDSVCGGTGI
ncbi:hypothetical protein GOP47_0030390 [Adiantum capillus-veneris]|nr:hypothetical protein GOP47_0030390 [Adiantum capillus-veneris]